LARSIAVTGLPRIRGEWMHFPGLLGPYLMSPAWLIHDVEVAYRVGLAWGSLWFSLAAVPAHAMARRVGVSHRGAMLVALLAVLNPDGSFTTTLLSEPYAYPVFLATVLVGCNTLVRPEKRRQAALLLLMLVLCLLRFQFILVPLAYLLAALVYSRFSVREA